MILSRLSLVPAILLVLIILSCGQDSIFFDISNEPSPKDPLITGNPTSLVLAKNELFVGSRMGNRIFRYGGESLQWRSIPAPRGSIGNLATDGEYLYALVFPGGNPLAPTVIQRFNTATNVWDAEFTSQYSVQTIYGVNGRIFAGASPAPGQQNFLILSLDRSELRVVKENTSLLRGAASDSAGNIYLATAGSGVFRASNGTVEENPVSGTENANLAGIIGTSGSVVAVSSNGTVYFLNSPGVFNSFTTGFIFTGAMSIWADRNNQWSDSLLLLGVRGRGSSISNGYREVVLDREGFPTITIRIPGDESPSSVSNRARYSASIGQHPVEAILQIPDISRGGPLDYNAFISDPDWEPPIFAGTSRSGLWSYRNGQWNAEE